MPREKCESSAIRAPVRLGRVVNGKTSEHSITAHLLNVIGDFVALAGRDERQSIDRESPVPTETAIHQAGGGSAGARQRQWPTITIRSRMDSAQRANERELRPNAIGSPGDDDADSQVMGSRRH